MSLLMRGLIKAVNGLSNKNEGKMLIDFETDLLFQHNLEWYIPILHKQISIDLCTINS